MIVRLILRTQKKWQLALAIIGSLFGLTLLLFSTQLYIDINKIAKEDKELINPQYLIINKQVSLINTFTKIKPGFSQDEIDSLKKLKKIDDVAAFKANNFSTAAYISEGESKAIPGLYTDLFFESIPDKYLDVKPDNWKWNPDDEVIPIIIPSDYINLYNFGFAPSQNLPQISKSSIGLAVFNIKIEGKDTTARFKGRIAGFSNRINTILVPESFMDYANKTFGKEKAKTPSRLILVSNDPTSTELANYLKSKGYETNSESLKSGKLNAFLNMILIIVTIIGIVIIFLSLLAFVQYAQLLISNADYEIRTLIQIGIYYLNIAKIIIVFFSSIFFAVLVGSLGFTYFLKSRLVLFTQNYGFEIAKNLAWEIYVYGLILIALLIFANMINIIVSVKRLAKS